MSFESFDDLARVGLKRAAMKAARVIVKSEFSERQRPQTVFRFSDDLVERAGWAPGEDRIELMIDRNDMAIRARKVAVGGYKALINPPPGRAGPLIWPFVMPESPRHEVGQRDGFPE